MKNIKIINRGCTPSYLYFSIFCNFLYADNLIFLYLYLIILQCQRLPWELGVIIKRVGGGAGLVPALGRAPSGRRRRPGRTRPLRSRYRRTQRDELNALPRRGELNFPPKTGPLRKPGSHSHRCERSRKRSAGQGWRPHAFGSILQLLLASLYIQCTSVGLVPESPELVDLFVDQFEMWVIFLGHVAVVPRRPQQRVAILHYQAHAKGDRCQPMSAAHRCGQVFTTHWQRHSFQRIHVLMVHLQRMELHCKPL